MPSSIARLGEMAYWKGKNIKRDALINKTMNSGTGRRAVGCNKIGRQVAERPENPRLIVVIMGKQ